MLALKDGDKFTSEGTKIFNKAVFIIKHKDCYVTLLSQEKLGLSSPTTFILFFLNFILHPQIKDRIL